VESAVEGIRKLGPDAIEIMPGILPRIIGHVSRSTTVPVIAGGLVQTTGDVEKILASGAVAISTTRSELWQFNPPQSPLHAVAAVGK
jgi:glycerol uptake operon antiterminator